MATFKRDEWRWKCCDCRIEYFVEDYRFCPRCGRARPDPMPSPCYNYYFEASGLIRRIESLERHCQCKGPPRSVIGMPREPSEVGASE